MMLELFRPLIGGGALAVLAMATYMMSGRSEKRQMKDAVARKGEEGMRKVESGAKTVAKEMGK